uniref:Uncharacterized protein n=1 Tax=Rhizophora mucronata TaxID=61149 RepID=A0A2P2KRW8_RHIMU
MVMELLKGTYKLAIILVLIVIYQNGKDYTGIIKYLLLIMSTNTTNFNN